MRTTLPIGDDVLLAARSLAKREQRSIGEVLSALARQALHRKASSAATRNGIPLLASKSKSVPVTLHLVNRMRDELA